VKVVLPEHARPYLEGRLPPTVEPAWAPGFHGYDRLAAAVPGAEVAWLDIVPPAAVAPVMAAAAEAKWINTSLAGVNGWPLEQIAGRGVVLTNGAGLNAAPVADFALMGVLAMAKGLPELVHAQDRHEYVARPPGTMELDGARALVIGWGAIGQGIGQRLAACGVEVIGVRRTPKGEADVIGPDQWRARLAEFDIVVLAAASTPETAGMIAAAELAAMKPSVILVNIARGDLIDQGALIAAAHAGRIGGAFLDVTDPEPSPPDDPVWTTPRITVTSHCSGRSQTGMPKRAAALFLDNLDRYLTGRPLRNQVDLKLGY
jgi:phosphoglycerate dehydrogenase-like enzyme